MYLAVSGRATMRKNDRGNDRLYVNRRTLLRTLGVGAGAMSGLGVISSSVLAWERIQVQFLGCSEVWIAVDDVDVS